MHQVEAVVFDIGNVLIEWQPERFYDARIGREARTQMFAEIDLHAMNDRIDRGAPFRDTVYDTAARHPRWEAQIRLWHDLWIELAGPEIGGSVHLMRALRLRGVPVFVLSNIGVETYGLVAARFGFLAEFDRHFLSGALGSIKPEPAIFAALEAESTIPPQHLLLADDRADNIAAARARGWQGHLFDGPEGWATRLVQAGLLEPGQAD